MLLRLWHETIFYPSPQIPMNKNPKKQENKCCHKCERLNGEWCGVPTCPCHSQESKREVSKCCGAIPFCASCSEPFTPEESSYTGHMGRHLGIGPVGEESSKECDKKCEKLGNHGHCITCGLLTQLIMECKCPERQSGNWVVPTPLTEEGEWKSKVINIVAKLDNGSHSSNQLQGVDEALNELIAAQIAKAEKRGYEKGKAKVMEVARGIVDPSVQESYLIEEEAWHKGMQTGLKEGKASVIAEIREKVQGMKKVLNPKDSSDDFARDISYNLAFDDLLTSLTPHQGE